MTVMCWVRKEKGTYYTQQSLTPPDEHVCLTLSPNCLALQTKLISRAEVIVVTEIATRTDREGSFNITKLHSSSFGSHNLCTLSFNYC